MLENLLVAVDSSTQQAAVLDQAAELAISTGAGVHVVSVANCACSGAVLVDPPSSALMSSVAEETQNVLKSACGQLSDKGVACTTHLCYGHVAEQIVELAGQIKADMIIIGHRHLNWMERLVEKSVGRDLVSRSPCNVLIVLEGSRNN